MKKTLYRKYYLLAYASLMAVFAFIVLLPMQANASCPSTWCVHDSTELQDCLTDAQFNGIDNEIKVEQGTYSGNFTYYAGGPYNLSLFGGYNADCSALTTEPTVLDGGGTGMCLNLNGLGGTIRVERFVITNGSANMANGDQSGGIYVMNTGDISLVNNIIYGNTSPSGSIGGGATLWAITAGNIFLTNNTISDNVAESGQGGGVFAYPDNGTITFTNNIIWGNFADALKETPTDVVAIGTALHFNNNDIHTPTYYSPAPVGTGNISSDPLFADAATGNFHIDGSSPCKDAGTNTGAPSRDIENNTRPYPYGGTVDIGAYEFIPAPLSFVALDADKTSPQQTNTTITWTADATGGVTPLTYNFYSSKDGGSEVLEQTDTVKTWAWTPTEVGTYTVKVVVTDSSVPAASVDSGWTSFTIINPPIVLSSLTPNPTSPQVKNTTITWTATASGGVGALSYKFQTWHSSTGILTPQTGSSNTYAWTPATVGGNYVKVIVTDTVGQSVDSGLIPYQIANPAVVLSSLTPDPASPQVKNTTITWTATASGGTGALTYKFQTWHSSTGTLSPQTGSSNTFAWTPATVGSNYVKVIVTDTVGQSVDSGWIAYQIVNPYVVLSSLTPAPASPQVKNTTITWTATASGGTGALTYKFQTWHSSTGILTPQTGSSNTYSWTPATVGSNYVKVIVTDTVGQSVDSGWIPYQIVNPYVVLTSMTPNPTSPQVANTPITWTADASGGTGALTYKFQTWHSSTGILTPQNGSSNTYAWTPVTVGSNYVKVIVTDTVGQSIDSGWIPYTITP